MSDQSLLSYYQDYGFNPVPISLTDRDSWHLHVAKRRNLYERHLGIPLSLLKDRSVLEFGCNSGENALVLASVGANLTLVEPNDQVFPRLKALFNKFQLEHRIISLEKKDIESFELREVYDLVVAEGFLNHLQDRDKILEKICNFVAPGGLGVISFDDRYGHMLEIARKFIFWLCYHLQGINNMDSSESLELAEKLYLEDFSRLNASRPFKAWWQDVLLNPFVSWEYLWTYHDVLPILENSGCIFHSSSPKWVSIDNFSWYKNVTDSKTRHQSILDEWNICFPSFLTGLPLSFYQFYPVPSHVFDAASSLVMQMSEYISFPGSSIDPILYPGALDNYFSRNKDLKVLSFNSEMKRLFEAIKSFDFSKLFLAYQGSSLIRTLWGLPYHYISFINSS